MLAVMGLLLVSGIISPFYCSGQNQKAMVARFLTKLPSGRPENNGKLQKYRMTAVYSNMDIYGNFKGKTRVTGDYTRGYTDGSVQWNNVFISGSNSQYGTFAEGSRKDYMENFRYIPSDSMLSESAFKNFPSNPENIFARNLTWDMYSVEMFAWKYNDSLSLNKTYVIPVRGGFNMAEIGKYYHEAIELCWTGISVLNGELSAVIGYRALNNKLELTLPFVKSRGTEQYWGNTWISLKTKQVEYAEIYSATFQELEVQGMKDKMLMKTIRSIYVERIK